MRKLLLAGALVLAVACQKETIEEQANDFVSIEADGLSAKNAALQWELGDGISIQKFNKDNNDYIVSQHSALIDSIEKQVFVTFINRNGNSGWDLSGIIVITDLLGPNEKRTTLIPSELTEFKLNLNTGGFYVNGTFGEYGNVNIEIDGKLTSSVDEGSGVILTFDGGPHFSSSSEGFISESNLINQSQFNDLIELVNNSGGRITITRQSPIQGYITSVKARARVYNNKVFILTIGADFSVLAGETVIITVSQ